MNMAALETHGLHKSFGALTVANAVDFRLEHGARHALIGPNGAGKTTCFNLLSGFMRPTSGTIAFGGADITGLKPHQVAGRGLARTFQLATLFQDMTALENVLLGLHLHSRRGPRQVLLSRQVFPPDEVACSREILEYTGLTSHADQLARNLPHGHQRVLGIAMALASRPQLLLLDEPVTGMNLEESGRVMALVIAEAMLIGIIGGLLACIGALGAPLLPPRARVLTHCNAGALATAGYGTALGLVRAAIEAGNPVTVFADETRPFFQGARLTAWELHRDGIPVTVLTDGMAGWLMQRGEISCVVVGSDRIAANGDVCNKIGTYALAVLARHHGIPFYVAAPWSTVDLATARGTDIPIEERASDEVTQVAGVRIAPLGVLARYPAFDVTPAALVTAIVTERGVVSGDLAKGLLELSLS